MSSALLPDAPFSSQDRLISVICCVTEMAVETPLWRINGMKINTELDITGEQMDLMAVFLIYPAVFVCRGDTNDGAFQWGCVYEKSPHESPIKRTFFGSD